MKQNWNLWGVGVLTQKTLHVGKLDIFWRKALPQPEWLLIKWWMQTLENNTMKKKKLKCIFIFFFFLFLFFFLFSWWLLTKFLRVFHTYIPDPLENCSTLVTFLWSWFHSLNHLCQHTEHSFLFSLQLTRQYSYRSEEINNRKLLVSKVPEKIQTKQFIILNSIMLIISLFLKGHNCRNEVTLSGDSPEICLHLLLQQFQSILQSTTLHQGVHLN